MGKKEDCASKDDIKNWKGPTAVKEQKGEARVQRGARACNVKPTPPTTVHSLAWNSRSVNDGKLRHSDFIFSIP